MPCVEIDAALARLVDGLKQRATVRRDQSRHRFRSRHDGDESRSHRRRRSRIRHERASTWCGAACSAATRRSPATNARPTRRSCNARTVMHCWRKGEMPARLHYGTNPRIPPYVCLADDGWLIDTQKWLDDPKHHPSKGEHGYDNDDPNMRALFVAHGPAFKRGLVVPEFDNVDVYPLLAKILHITPQRQRRTSRRRRRHARRALISAVSTRTIRRRPIPRPRSRATGRCGLPTTDGSTSACALLPQRQRGARSPRVPRA